MLAKVGLGPGEDAQDELVRPGEAGRYHPGDVLVGHERTLEHGVVAAGGTHAERVPSLEDAVTAGVARHEGVDDLRVCGVARVHGVQAQPRPDWRERAKDLMPVELVATLGTFGFGAREQSTGRSLPASP